MFLTQVTYPYIMAKVRLQAPPEDSETEALENGTPVKRAPRYSGAVDVLRKVFAEKGPFGWYQVGVPDFRRYTRDSVP